MRWPKTPHCCARSTVRPPAAKLNRCVRCWQPGPGPDTVQAGGYTALHSAARQGHEAMVQALCEAGADRTLRTDKGESAADLAPTDSPVRALLS